MSSSDRKQSTIKSTTDVKMAKMNKVEAKNSFRLLDQQRTLENSGIPGFHVTTNPTETKVQMYLLEFITRLDSNEVFTPRFTPS